MKTTLASTFCGLVVCSVLWAVPARAADDSVQIGGTLGASSPGHVSLRGEPRPSRLGHVRLSTDGSSERSTAANNSRRRAGRASYNHVDPARYVIQQQDPQAIGSGGYEESGIGYAVAAPFGPLIGLEGVFGTGPGFGDYYRAGVFLPRFMNNGNSLFFLSINGATTADRGDGIGNFGAGYRVFSEELQRIFTVAGFFDIDDGNSDTFYRTGVSLESLGKYLDFRVNADFVVGNDSNLLFNGFTGTPVFQQNFLMLNRRQTSENAFSSVDYEVGGPVPFLSRFGVSQYFGGYHYYSDNDDSVNGFKLRTEVAVTDDLTVNVNWSHDTLFGSNTFVNVALSLPNGRSQRRFRKRRIHDRLSQRIQRNNRIPTHIRTTNTPTPLTNPADGAPFFFAHVGPDAGALGNGTFETPFKTLEAARLANVASNDILYVRPRADGTTTNLAVTSSLALFNNQRLLASNISHLITATQGTFTIPTIGSGGIGPLITNSATAAGSVVTLANNNEVAGFLIDGSVLHNGIIGQAAGVNGFNINRNTIRNGANGILLANTFGTGLLTQNIVSGHTTDGAKITLASANTLNLTAKGNSFLTNGGDGLNVTAAVGTVNATIGGPNAADGNIFLSNGDAGLDFNLSGIATSTLTAQNNTTISAATTTGLNFTASTLADAGALPPDTMGGIGPNHIVELVNGVYRVFNKTTGVTLTARTLNQFWTDAGVTVPTGQSTFDPRIIYDPVSGRWFAVSIDGTGGSANNNIYVARSNSSDPTAGWKGLKFTADAGTVQFNDFDTLGINGDSLVIATNNFPTAGGFSVSVYNIPKADLLLTTPSITNRTEFRNLSSGTRGSSIQPVVDFGAATGQAQLLAADSSGSTLLKQTNITGAAAASAVLGGTTNITVPTYTTAPSADQPGPKPNLENTSPRINGNVVKVGGSFWASHIVADPVTGRSAVRWYEINSTTNTLTQTGLISDPNLDFLESSIAVNSTGNVVIGFTGSGAGQFASSMAAVGRTAAGTTTFDTPILLKAGVSDYSVLAGGRNRWGDYSATVVDPTDSSVFWTFQQFVDATDSYAVQVTQVKVGSGGNTGDGIRVTVGGTSTLTSALIDNNTLTDNLGAGLNMIATGGGRILSSTITNNSVSRNGTGMSLTSTGAGSTFTVPAFSNNSIVNNTGSGATLSALSGGLLTFSQPVVGGAAGFVNNTFTGNGADGILGTADAAGSKLILNLGALPATGATSLPNTFSSNTGNGISLIASNTATLTGGIINNSASNNTLAGLNLQSLSGGIFGTLASPFTVTKNTISTNQSTGITALVDGVSGSTNSTMNLVIGGVPASSANILSANRDAGIWIRGKTTGILQTLSIQGNTITGTTDNTATTGVNNPAGDGIFLDREDNADFGRVGGIGTNSGLGDIVIGNNTIAAQTGRGNTITGNAGSGIRLYAIGANAPGVNTLLFDGNTLTGNTVDGFGADLFASAQFLIANQGNTFATNTGFGIRLVTNQSAVLGNPVAGTASTFLADTFTNNTAGQFSTTANNSSFQNIRIGSTATTRTTMTGGGGNAITIVNRSTLSGAVPTPNTFQIDGTDIDLKNAGSDGINITASGTGGTTVNVGTTTANQNVTITKAGDDGIDYTQTTGTNTLTIRKTAISSSTDDGIKIQQTSGNLTTTITGSSANANGGRGLDINVQRRVAAAGTDDSGSVFVIGGTTAADGNTFNNNVQQGVVFKTVTTVAYSATANVSDPASVSNTYQDITSPAQVISNLTFVSNKVQFNGNATSLVDGMALEVGTSTRLDAIINSNTFGGNVLADLNIVPIVSVNPTGVSANNAVSGPPILDRVALDPTALLNLALGVNASSGVAPTISVGNTGEQFAIRTQGTGTALVGSSSAGQFTNTDIFKPTTRAVSGVFNIWSQNGIDTAIGAGTANSFIQSGITQSLIATINASNVNIGTGFTGGSPSRSIKTPATVFP